MSNNRKIMGAQTNSVLANVLGWLITGLMTVAVIPLLLSLV
jgi:Mn2+/Fe2+ NRAMP family transporter